MRDKMEKNHESIIVNHVYLKEDEEK